MASHSLRSASAVALRPSVSQRHDAHRVQALKALRSVAPRAPRRSLLAGEWPQLNPPAQGLGEVPGADHQSTVCRRWPAGGLLRRRRRRRRGAASTRPPPLPPLPPAAVAAAASPSSGAGASQGALAEPASTVAPLDRQLPEADQRFAVRRLPPACCLHCKRALLARRSGRIDVCDYTGHLRSGCTAVPPPPTLLLCSTFLRRPPQSRA